MIICQLKFLLKYNSTILYLGEQTAKNGRPLHFLTKLIDKLSHNVMISIRLYSSSQVCCCIIEQILGYTGPKNDNINVTVTNLPFMPNGIFFVQRDCPFLE